MLQVESLFYFFFFNDTATTEIYTLSLHDALPISARVQAYRVRRAGESARLVHDSAQGACAARAGSPVRLRVRARRPAPARMIRTVFCARESHLPQPGRRAGPAPCVWRR